jgi:transposase
MPKKRRKYSREFKIEAVRMVSEGGRSVAETARELSISPNLLTRWKQQFSASGDQAFPGKGRLADEVRRLQLELKRVQQERDFLKKTAAFFARESK